MKKQAKVVPFKKKEPLQMYPLSDSDWVFDDKTTVVTPRTLLSFLGLVRRDGSKGEKIHVDKLLDIITLLGHTPSIDGAGNIIVNTLPEDDDITKSRVMFTSHTDTVHSAKSPNTRQKIGWVGDKKQVIGLADSHSNCLGADDATGNYIMLRLLQAGVQALFVFFRAEEIGGIGSDYFCKAKGNEALLNSMTHCISFDRMDYHSIITHQGMGRCASNEWANDFATTIKGIDETLDFYPDDGGVFTDSANFTHIIPECTNISVGYFNQHSTAETQDIAFVEQLCTALEQVDWQALTWYRDPSVVENLWDYGYGYTGKKGNQAYDYYHQDFLYMEDYLLDEVDNLKLGGREYAMELVVNDPQTATDLLMFMADNT